MSRQSELAQLGRVFDSGPLSNRNLIINGAMQVAQRGTSFTSDGYTVDRWAAAFNVGTLTFEQSTDAPAGFKNSVKITSGASVTPTSSQYALFDQRFEGNNIAHLDLGKTTANTITLSFWTKSSLTGTFSVSLISGSDAAGSYRSSVMTYSITSANTWEYKTIVFPLDANTSYAANYPTDSSRALMLRFDLGNGSSYEGSATGWATGLVYRTSASNRLISTNGATLYLTGVQLEVGDTATPFEHRSYGQELALCQRYYYALRSDGNSNGRSLGMTGAVASGNTTRAGGLHPVEMRASPSVSIAGLRQWDGVNVANITGLSGFFGTAQALSLDVSGGGLTSGNAGTILFQNSTTPSTSYLTADAEL